MSRYTYQQTEIPNDYLGVSHNDLIDNIIRFYSKRTDKRSVHDLYYLNIYNLGIVPFNFQMLKKDVPLLNIILHASLFDKFKISRLDKHTDGDHRLLKMLHLMHNTTLAASDKAQEYDRTSQYAIYSWQLNDVLMYSLTMYGLGPSYTTFAQKNMVHGFEYIGTYRK